MREPLGLPRGSVRAIMALSAWMTFLTVVGLKGSAPQELAALIGVLTVSYFRSREKEENRNED